MIVRFLFPFIPSFLHVLVFAFRKRAGWNLCTLRFCIIVEAALVCSREDQGGMRTADCRDWVGLDVQEQLHAPAGQPQVAPQLQVHPGAARRDRGVS